jgi:threonine dehydrogenase-like Zn-dependent dehydrogenase
MRALVFKDNVLRLEKEYPEPLPRDGEALIRVLQIGICNTDLEIIRGYMGFEGILGHEFVGVVEEIFGEQDARVRERFLGKRVVGEINAACYRADCPYCQRDISSHCPDRTTLGIGGRNGAFAEYLMLPIQNLHLVPDNVSDEEAVFVEPLAANFEILEQVHVRPTDSVIVLGDGKMGQLAAQVLALSGCDVTMLGKHEDKLFLARQRGIATEQIDAQGSNSFLQHGERVDMVVECTGSEAGLELALRLVRPRGTVILKSTVAARSTLHLASIVIDEIRIQGSRCGPFAPALRTLSQGRVDVRPLISARYTLDEALPAFERATQSGVLKVLVRV